MSFFGLNVALSGLRAQQQAMNVTANNIANASTEGYHRQEAAFVPGAYLSGAFATVGVGTPQLGTGVMIQRIKRLQSDYIDQQVRTAQSNLGTWDYRKEELAQVESVFAEPGDLGISAAMDQFWDAWEELSASPESESARISVVETGITLSQRITTLNRSLREMQSRADQDVVDNVAQVNRLAHEVADLSAQIKRSMANGFQPNEILDRRDILLDQLSKIAGVQISGAAGADLIIAISGRPLVQSGEVNELATAANAQGWSQVTWAEDGSAASILGGQLLGQLQVRDVVLVDHIASLNDLARTLVDQVNTLYSTGLTSDGLPAGNFFVAGSDAASIVVEPGLVSHPSLLATSATGRPGDNGLAKAIARLRTQELPSGETLNVQYLRLVAQLGAQSRESISRTEVSALTLDQLNAQRESVSGVSLDEEMLNMTRFQQAYNAAARVATTMDEMIDTIVSRMGVVGR